MTRAKTGTDRATQSSSRGIKGTKMAAEPWSETSARITVIPECGGCIAGHWTPGQGITVHASEGKPTPGTRKPEHFRYPVLHEVRWDADSQNTITRRLIAETHGIFLDLQQLPETGGTARKSSLITVSRRYRAVLRALILELEAARKGSNIKDNKTATQKQLLSVIELVWYLCEILFIETLPGGAVLHHLLEWIQTEQTEKYIKDVLSCSPPHESSSYWPAIYSLILQGRINDARELLSQHPEKQPGTYDAFESIDECLRKMPLYQMFMGQTAAEFTLKWNHWQQECKCRLEDEMFAAYPELQTICQILCGEEEVFETLKVFCPTWYQMMVSKLLFCNPAVKSYDLQYHTQSCMEMFGGNSQLGHLDRILLSAFEFDVFAVIKQSSESLGNWWFVAHMTDLLHHSGQLESHQISHGVSLREFLLLEYVASLMSHHSLWRVAVDYLLQCPCYGRAHLEEYIEHLPLETEMKAHKVIKLCEDLDMPSQAQSICKTMSMRALRRGRQGSALDWCLRSKDAAFAALVSDRFLASYCESGRFSNLDLIDGLGSGMLLSDRLTFLGKYREFHRVYGEGKFKEAAHLLISLLTSKLAPKKLWLTLLTDALPLLEHNEVIFTSSQTYELMHGLEEICLSFRSHDYLGHAGKEPSNERSESSRRAVSGKKPSKTTPVQRDEEQEKLDLLRLALARNLARSILQEGQTPTGT